MFAAPDLSDRRYELTTDRAMALSADVLYRAWTQEFDRWFAAPGSVLMEPRIDAPFFFQTDFQGARHPHYGRFLRLEPARLVELTWVTGDGGTEGAETVVTVTFTPEADGTRVRLRHAGFPREELRDGHRDAWPLVLEQQEKALRA
ncbi:SRPBCC family protein [Fodinicola acaciae]|uniref:SRPBCC family protein n=1 Tax=Fodinicola acaciae TaxID=2681555 RepID=UPI001FE52B0A|nr:SRPBCC domain-containing protein [Fodinicola acaciae]